MIKIGRYFRAEKKKKQNSSSHSPAFMKINPTALALKHYVLEPAGCLDLTCLALA